MALWIEKNPAAISLLSAPLTSPSTTPPTPAKGTVGTNAGF
jgi:hypothetical protein